MPQGFTRSWSKACWKVLKRLSWCWWSLDLAISAMEWISRWLIKRCLHWCVCTSSKLSPCNVLLDSRQCCFSHSRSANRFFSKQKMSIKWGKLCLPNFSMENASFSAKIWLLKYFDPEMLPRCLTGIVVCALHTPVLLQRLGFLARLHLPYFGSDVLVPRGLVVRREIDMFPRKQTLLPENSNFCQNPALTETFQPRLGFYLGVDSRGHLQVGS